MKIGTKEKMLVIKTRRGPKCPTMRGKAVNWKRPFIIPNPAIHKPIEAGLMPSPPNSTDVVQTSGKRDALITSSSPNMQ